MDIQVISWELPSLQQQAQSNGDSPGKGRTVGDRVVGEALLSAFFSFLQFPILVRGFLSLASKLPSEEMISWGP